MSPEELICPEHGPYLAELGACPYCKPPIVERPAPPKPLDEGEAAPSPPYPPPLKATPAKGASEAQLPPQPVSPRTPPASPPQPRVDPEATQPPKSRRLILDEDEIEKTMDSHSDTSGLLGWLIVKSSPTLRRGQVLKIKPNSIWGRNPRRANIVIEDPRVSGEHARIRIEENTITIADLDSTHGTFVNGKPIQGRKIIQQDDEIQMGDTIFVLKTMS